MGEQTASDMIAACLQAGSELAWRTLVRELQPLIASVLVRIVRRYGDQNLALVDDLVQETFLRLCRDDCKVLRQFKQQHESAIFGFVKVVAASVATDHFRAQNAQKRAGEYAMDSEVLDRTAVAKAEKPDQGVLLEQVEGCLNRVTESKQEQSLFWLYYRQGFTAVEIAGMSGVQLSAKGVESCLLRLVKGVRYEMNKKHSRPEGRHASSTVGDCYGA